MRKITVDSMPQGDPGGDPWERICQVCKWPIGRDEPVEVLKFDPGSEHRLEEMNVAYHAACAKPYLSIKWARDMLNRPFL